MPGSECHFAFTHLGFSANDTTTAIKLWYCTTKQYVAFL